MGTSGKSMIVISCFLKQPPKSPLSAMACQAGFIKGDFVSTYFRTGQFMARSDDGKRARCDYFPVFSVGPP